MLNFALFAVARHDNRGRDLSARNGREGRLSSWPLNSGTGFILPGAGGAT
jgi:hypothetical protein